MCDLQGLREFCADTARQGGMPSLEVGTSPGLEQAVPGAVCSGHYKQVGEGKALTVKPSFFLVGYFVHDLHSAGGRGILTLIFSNWLFMIITIIHI